MYLNRNHPQGHVRRRGFTLLELVISVALVLVLMLAVTKIFSIAGDTVGASQGIAAAVRDARAAQSVMVRDFGAMVGDSPFLVIRSQTQAAFRNRADMESDLGYDAQQFSDTQIAQIRSIDLAGSGTESDYGPFLLNVRNHRLDAISFFARDKFSRATANNGLLVADMKCSEAWITYGHVVLPDNGASYLAGSPLKQLTPGSFNGIENPNNFFASQWFLGRVAMLLKEKWDPDGTGPLPLSLYDNSFPVTTAGEQAYYDSNPAAPTNNVQPLDIDPARQTASSSWQLRSPGGTFSTSTRIDSSRFDLAATSIGTFKTKLTNYISNDPASNLTTTAYNDQWWNKFTGRRFEANPFVYKPIGSLSAAKQSPLFLSSCTQFIIEFAGDYYTQDANGIPTSTDPDNVVDFFIDGHGVRQTRWYGLPRDTNGDGIIRAYSGDVTPVCDLGGVTRPFEREFPLSPKAPQAVGSPLGNYVLPFTANASHKDKYGNTDAITQLIPGSASVDAVPSYVVAWGPNDADRPKMYRITFTIDRPEMATRSADGQTFEYVFTAP